MTKYIELIDRYEIRQSDSDEYNPPSYIWRDNTGELIRCKDCRYLTQSTVFDRTTLYCIRHRDDGGDWKFLENDEGFCSWAEMEKE